MNIDEYNVKLTEQEIYHLTWTIEKAIEYGVDIESAKDLIKIYDKLKEVKQ